MRNPLIDEIRRIRAKMARERAQNPDRDYIAEAAELRRKVCDVVVTETGETHYITNKEKLYEVLVAPRLAKQKRSARNRPVAPAR